MFGFSFPFILWGVIFISALLWGVDRFCKPKGAISGLSQLGRSFFPVLLCAGIFRSFIGEMYYISSESMQPNLNVGDYIWVNKLAYGLKAPFFQNAWFKSLPSRGDVVVFKPPQPLEAHYYIKRVVGLPGDHVRYDSKTHELFINGQVNHYHQSINGLPDVFIETHQNSQYKVIRKTLRNSLKRPSEAWLPNQGAIVPSGHYFLLGDQRLLSEDSRVWGVLTSEKIIGRATFGITKKIDNDQGDRLLDFIPSITWL